MAKREREPHFFLPHPASLARAGELAWYRRRKVCSICTPLVSSMRSRPPPAPHLHAAQRQSGRFLGLVPPLLLSNYSRTCTVSLNAAGLPLHMRKLFSPCQGTDRRPCIVVVVAAQRNAAVIHKFWRINTVAGPLDVRARLIESRSCAHQYRVCVFVFVPLRFRVFCAPN